MNKKYFRLSFKGKCRMMVGLVAVVFVCGLTCCTAQEPTNPGNIPGEPGAVRFSLVGGDTWDAGDGTGTRAAALAKTAGEKTINKLCAVIFSDTNGNGAFDESADKYLKTVEATYDATNKFYQFSLDSKGTYHAFFVANVAPSWFSALAAGVSSAASFKILACTLDADDSKRGSNEAKGHVMVTPNPKTFTYTKGSDPLEVGPIELQHLCARIEVVNNSIYDISKITMNNNMATSGYVTPLSNPLTSTTEWSGSGNIPLLYAYDGQTDQKTFYVYENSSSAKRATFTIEYKDNYGIKYTTEVGDITYADGSGLKIERNKRYILTIKR